MARRRVRATVVAQQSVARTFDHLADVASVGGRRVRRTTRSQSLRRDRLAAACAAAFVRQSLHFRAARGHRAVAEVLEELAGGGKPGNASVLVLAAAHPASCAGGAAAGKGPRCGRWPRAAGGALRAHGGNAVAWGPGIAWDRGLGRAGALLTGSRASERFAAVSPWSGPGPVLETRALPALGFRLRAEETTI